MKSESAALRIAKEEARRPFDLSTGPIWRAMMLKLADDDYVFLLSIHHVAYDMWTGWVLFREIETLYIAYAAGQPSLLPELPIQYADFAAWQRQWLQGPLVEKQRAYWDEQLEQLDDQAQRAGVPHSWRD